MLKKMIRVGLAVVVALGLTLPLLNRGVAQEQKTDETARSKNKKKTEKSKRKGKSERRKAEEPKAQ
jgi:hypothetical protein